MSVSLTPPDDTASEDSATAHARFSPRTVLLVLLSLTPFWAIPVSHVVSSPETATGFFQYELPYYVANGRSAFERGNGLFYPNPYNPEPDAPSIYVHWLPWTLGLLTTQVGFDPGDTMLTFTFFASIAFAFATRSLVSLRTTSERDRNMAFMGAMLGGGVLCAAGSVLGPVTGHIAPPGFHGERILWFDPGQGMWFLNWGRNALFPTEAIYHSLVALCWISEIKGRPRLANVWLILLATTHPWSGLELLLTINLWRGVCFLRQRTTANRNQLSISVVTLAAFLGYYKVWLPSFSSHAEIQSVWELDWSLSWDSALFAWILVLIPCYTYVRRRVVDGQWQRSDGFFICAAVVALGLALHDRMIKPVQPLHFTRGYVWMPLFLLGLPVLLDWWKRHLSSPRSSRSGGGPPGLRRLLRLSAILVPVLFVSDNLMFSVVHSQRQLNQQDGFHLDTDERALLATLHHRNLQDHVLLTESATLNYLLPTYARSRPWLGHHFNTPEYPIRKDVWESCFAFNEIIVGAIPDEVDLLVVRRDRDTSRLRDTHQWRSLALQNAEWRAWTRTPLSSGAPGRANRDGNPASAVRDRPDPRL